MPPSSLDLLRRLLDDSYEKKAWQGPNLKGSLRGVTAVQAAWRPAPGRHSIAELVAHAAYWKYAVARMLAGGKRGAFPEKGSNWFARTGPANETSWKADVANLGAQHRALLAAVGKLTAADLSRRPKGSRYTVDALLYGVASHDVYHTGQIQMLKRLFPNKRRTRR